jgi:hypothetical protein
MPGDNTRFTFNPFADHLGVLMQQGRVLLDADFNELIEILDRRLRSETTDIIGRGVVPLETPDGFRIQLAGGVMTIGRGRAYVDGLQAENHGKAPLEFEPHLAELRGTLPVPYDEQPYLPNAAALAPLPAGGGPHLVYLDVWEREVTYLQEPALMEKALGVDTATRLQTVWQVKVLANTDGVSCATPDGEIPGWVALTTPSGGRLTTSAVGVPTSTDPCVVNPSGGYRGTENRLYRVEIHTPGPLGTATFKWSRDNGSIASAVTGINAGRDVLTVTRTARDAVLRFSPGDWIEVTDDWHELHRQPGLMRKVLFVDDVAQTIQLAAALPAGQFDGVTPQSRHTRVVRWDQKGIVRDAANNPVADVDASGGVIPVPASGNLVLEDGVEVSFTFDPAGAPLRTGDFWGFAARTVDASVELLDHAPPRGIHHHFCRLAMITFPSTVTDCRVFWPPSFGGEEGCDCSVCVTPQSHNGGTLTIQMAVDQVKTGGKVCLAPGVYFLRAPVEIEGARSVAVHGHGVGTMLVYTGAGAAVRVVGSIDVDLESFSVLALGAGEAPAAALGVMNAALVRVSHCALLQFGSDLRAAGAAVVLGGFAARLSLRENVLFGTSGVVTVAALGGASTGLFAAARSYALLWDAFFDDNLVLGRQAGLRFGGATIHVGQTRVAGNSIYGGQVAGVTGTGVVLPAPFPSSRLDVTGNQLVVTGEGVVIGCDSARVAGNDLGALGLARRDGEPSGIVLVDSITKAPVDRCAIVDNRVTGFAGQGIALRGRAGTVAIERNTIDACALGGVMMERSSRTDRVTIRGNQILRSGLVNNEGRALAAIVAYRAAEANVSDNVIGAFALPAVSNPSRAGIVTGACHQLRIDGNDLTDIGPPSGFARFGAGISVGPGYDRVDVSGNAVRRAAAPPAPDTSQWHALFIQSRTLVVGPFNVGDLIAVNLGAFKLWVFGDFLTLFPDRSEVVAIHGNQLEAYGGVRAVDVDTEGPCTLQDNRCFLAPSAAGAAPLPVVRIASSTALASANLVRRTPQAPDLTAVELLVRDGFTAVANICAGPIHVNGAALGAPWAPLNVVAP